MITPNDMAGLAGTSLPTSSRNGLKTITGDLGRLDRTTWKTLTAILEQPLPALTA